VCVCVWPTNGLPLPLASKRHATEEAGDGWLQHGTYCVVVHQLSVWQSQRGGWGFVLRQIGLELLLASFGQPWVSATVHVWCGCQVGCVV
jgi:hypothetical protein